jgi:hypothetical protein
MPFQKDYVLRTIEAFAKAMAAIVALRKDGQTETARHELDRAARGLCGADLAMLEAIGVEAVAARLDGPETAGRLATLVDERAEVERARGDEAAAQRWTARAAALRGWRFG